MPTIVGKEVGPIGYGLMGLTWSPSPPPDSESFMAMKAALAKGANFWNGGEIYGPPDANSLTLLKRYFTKYPEDADKVVLSIKGGVNVATHSPDGSKEGIARSINACLEQLGGTKKIDLFECARVDKTVPLEETMLALKEYVDAGKIGGIGLSEVGAKTIREAAKIVKIDAVEVEVSIWSPDILKNGVAQACAELNIPIVAYSPIGRGILSGKIKSLNDIPKGDMRRRYPRFQPGAFEENLKLVHAVEAVAERRGCTAAQLAIGWVMCLSKKPGRPTIIPIPGARNETRVNENLAAVQVTDAEMDEIERAMEQFEVIGGRYADGHPIEG